MEQLRLTYFFPLTEQPDLDLDYTPCKKYEEDKLKNSQYIGNRMDQWGVTSNYVFASNGTGPVWTTNTAITDPRLIVYPESIPITIRTTNKPSFFARMVYKVIGAKWEKA